MRYDFYPPPELENTKRYTTAQDYFNEAEMYLSLIESMIDDEEDGIIQESFTDDVTESIKYAIVALIKGKKAMIKESTEAAQNAETYKNQLDKVLHVRGRGESKAVWEQYTMVYVTGDIVNTYSQTKKFADFYSPIYDYKKIITLATTDLSSLKNRYKHEWGDVIDNTKFRPYIQGIKQNGNMNTMAKKFSNEIDNAKKLGKAYEKAVDDMINNMQSGLKEIKALKGDKENKIAIKYIKKYVQLQKKCLVHCNSIIHTNNLMILRWSREVKRIIDTYSE